MRGLTHVIDSFEGTILTTAGAVESELEQGEPPRSSFSPCGMHLISGSRDGALHIWDVATGSEEARLTGKELREVILSMVDSRSTSQATTTR